MADVFKTVKVTQATPGGPLQQQLIGAVDSSTGAADAGKVVLLDSTGQISPSMGGGGGGTSVFVNGSSVSNPNFQDGDILWHVSGSNVTATVQALATNTVTPVVTNTSAPAHAGQLLISQPGNASAVWADPLVQGLYPIGTPISTPINPVFIGASDGTNLQAVLVDGSGNLKVAQQGAVSVTGTVVVSSVTNPVTISGTVAVSSVGGTVTVAGSSSDNSANSSAKLPVLGAVANTVNPTWTNGNQVPLSVDTSGNLRVSATGGGGTQYTDGATQATPTGTVALGKNPSNILHALSLDASGFMNVNIAAGSSNASVSATGSAVPAFASFMGLQDDAGNLKGVLGETAAHPNVRVAIYSGGNLATVTGQNALTTTDLSNTTANTTTAPTKIIIVGGKTNDVTPQYQALPMTSGGAAVFVSNVDSQSQGSTTSGQKGTLIQGAVTTNAPSYTTAQTDPLSLNTSGYLRTTDFAASVSANGSTSVPTNAMFVGFKGADGFLHAAKSSTNDGALDVNATFSGTINPGFVADRQVSGSIASTSQVVNASTQGASMVSIRVSGSWTGTLTFQLSTEDGTYATANAYPAFTGGAVVTTTTANGVWVIPVGGASNIQVFGTTISSGSATISIEIGAGNMFVYAVQPTAGNLNMTATQGTAASNANAWTAKITDGSNVLGTSANPFITQDKADGAPGTASQPTEAMQVAGWDGTHLRVISVDASGNLNVNASGTFTPALTPDRIVNTTNTITSTQNVPISTQGAGTVMFNITGTWTGTIVFEASVDGSNWVAAKVVPRFPTADTVSQTTANGQWAFACGGVNSFRVRGNTVASGTATVILEAGAGNNNIEVIQPDANNLQVTATSVGSSTSNAVVQNTVNTGSSNILSANTSRKEMTIINTGLTVIFLGLGQTPTTTQYHIALAACSSANDGTGGTYTTDIWKGQVNAISSAGGGTVCVLEMT